MAIYEVRAGQVLDEYRTLIDPERDIPPQIAAATGIARNMVSSAPHSDQIADEVLRWIRGRVLVARNARFDRRFLSQRLAEAIGEVPQVERLCTFGIARCIVPRLRHWNLEGLARQFVIGIVARQQGLWRSTRDGSGVKSTSRRSGRPVPYRPQIPLLTALQVAASGGGRRGGDRVP